jgi:hypothetical protein
MAETSHTPEGSDRFHLKAVPDRQVEAPDGEETSDSRYESGRPAWRPDLRDVTDFRSTAEDRGNKVAGSEIFAYEQNLASGTSSHAAMERARTLYTRDRRQLRFDIE